MAQGWIGWLVVDADFEHARLFFLSSSVSFQLGRSHMVLGVIESFFPEFFDIEHILLSQCLHEGIPFLTNFASSFAITTNTPQYLYSEAVFALHQSRRLGPRHMCLLYIVLYQFSSAPATVVSGTCRSVGCSDATAVTNFPPECPDARPPPP